MNHNDWQWWKDKLHNYKEIDSLSEEEKSRVIFCCLEFIVNSLQPERSKREDCFEDFQNLGHEMTTIPLSDECWCIKCEQPNFVIRSKQMRCSEHCGNTVRDK